MNQGFGLRNNSVSVPEGCA